MTYRMAEDTDIDDLTDLRIAYLHDNHGTFSKEKETIIRQQLPDYYKQHLNEDLFVYIAEYDDEIVATVYLLIEHKPANLRFLIGKVGDVLSVYTKKEYRKQGISTHLIKQMIEDGKKMGLSYVELEATEDGYPVYKKCGFEDSVNQYKPMVFNMGR